MKKYLTLLLFVLSSIVGVAQDQVSIDVVVPHKIVEGEHFNVQFILNTSKARDIKLPSVNGLDLLYGPAEATSTSVSIINGNMSRTSTKTFTYTFIANRAGDYTIPSATVTVGSSTYKTKEKRIKVFSQSAAYGSSGGNPSDADTSGNTTVSQGSGKDFFVTVSTSNQNVYEQEGFLVTFKLYAYNPQFEFLNVKFPDFDGFVKRDVERDSIIQLDTEEHNGTVYYTAILSQYILFPQKAGTLTIPAGSFDLLISERQEDPTFGAFGSIIGQYTQKRRTVNSSPFAVKVKALPTPKPEGFTGAVGSFNLVSDIPNYTTKTNESYTMTLKLEGKGNLKLAQVPEVEFPEGFEVYDPKEEDNIALIGSGETGWKTKQYIAVPRFKGDYVIPEVKFSYFDTTQGQYRTITLPAQKVHVDQGSNSPSSSEVSNFNDKERIKILNQDIRYLKTIGSGRSATQISYLAYGLSYVAILLIGIALLFLIRHRRSESLETIESRAKRAGSMARRYLKLAASKRHSGDHLAYYEALLRGLNSYLSAKFHIPTSELSKETIKSKMQSLGLPDTLIQQTIETQTYLELARYTPDGGLIHKDELYDKAAHVIDNIQSFKIKIKA